MPNETTKMIYWYKTSNNFVEMDTLYHNYNHLGKHKRYIYGTNKRVSTCSSDKY